MLSYRILRYIQCKNSNVISFKYLTQLFCSESSDDEKKRKKEKSMPTPTNPKKTEEALKNLNLLLKQMVEEDHHIPSKKIDHAKPRPRSFKKKSEPEKQPQDIIKAAKDVAESLGGDIKQTESELLTKLLNPINNDTSENTTKKALNLSDVISGMKIDRTVKLVTNSDMFSKAHQVRQIVDRNKLTRTKEEMAAMTRRKPRIPSDRTDMEKIDLFGGETLEIFTNNAVKFKEEQPTLKTWDMLHKRELQLAVTHPPANYFQEMILWTKQGKLWSFPIDNEAGMEEEQNVYFADHVFLEKHIEAWCPTRGPIRHFMELVCVGLSKNPYLSVQAKRDHIEWFKNYFSTKDELLKEIGAIPADFKELKQLDG